MNKHLSSDSLLLLINYCSKNNNKKNYQYVKRKDGMRIRFKDESNKTHEYKLSLTKGQKINSEYIKIQQERDHYTTALNIWRSRYNCEPPYIDMDKVKKLVNHLELWNVNYYNELIADQNQSFLQNKVYPYKGVLYRSKSEVLIAKTLDNLNIEFKYEPAVNLAGEVIYSDFVPYVPWLFACFPFEHFGKIGPNNSYTDDMTTKLKKYARAGLLPGYNFTFTVESDISTFNADKIENEIITMINSISSKIISAYDNCERSDTQELTDL